MPKLPKINVKKSRFLSRFFALIAVLIVFLAGTLTGAAYDNHIHGADMAKFWQVYDLVKGNYVGTVDSNKLIEGAISGLVGGLGDPFSSYLPPTDKQTLNNELSGQFEGIGAELIQKNGVITVQSPLPNTPAEKAGLKASDVIVKIDGASTEGMSVNDAVAKIRGPKGSSVVLTILRSGAASTQDISITRDNIQVRSVTSKVIIIGTKLADGSTTNKTVGYIEIDQFGEDTVSGLQQAVSNLSGQNIQALVIDLRNNPGGYLNDVPPMAGLFIPPSVVVKEQYKDGKSDELRSTSVPVMPNTPMYILTNGGSASAAEIFAGVMQDYKRATVIGEKSFGKGSVQDLIDLPGNSALRVTIAEWLTPNGRTINKTGVTPDIQIKDAKTDTSDPVLDKALQLTRQ